MSASAAAKERERQEEALKKQEQAKTERLALVAEVELKQREQAEADWLGEQAKAERLQREQADAAQLEAERKAKEESAGQAGLERQRLAAELTRLDEERKQAAAEKARLEELERERQAGLEKSRQEEELELAAAEKARREADERQHAVAEQARMEEERQQATAEEALSRPRASERQHSASGQILDLRLDVDEADRAGQHEDVTFSRSTPREVRFWPSAWFSLFGWAVCMYVLFVGEAWWGRGSGFYSLTVMSSGVGLCFLMGTAVTASTARLAGLWPDWRQRLRYACGWASAVSLLMLGTNFFIPFVFWGVLVVAILGVIVGVLLLRMGFVSPLFEASSPTRRLPPLVIALFWSSAFLLAGLYASLTYPGVVFFQRHGPPIVAYSLYYIGSDIRHSLLLSLFGATAGGGPSVAALWHLHKRFSAAGSQ